MNTPFTPSPLASSLQPTSSSSFADLAHQTSGSTSTSQGSLPVPPAFAEAPGSPSPSSAANLKRNADHSATLEPPQKRRRLNARPNDGTELDAWLISVKARSREALSRDLDNGELELQDIADSHSRTWTSVVYQHYHIGCKRATTNGVTSFDLTFTCKFNNKDHPEQRRPLDQTSWGTKNLWDTLHSCGADPTTSASNSTPSIPPYTESRHRLFLAKKCTVHKRPFNIVEDDAELDIARLLSGNPDICLPSIQTITRDVDSMFLGLSDFLTAYFKTRSRTIHVADDGWCMPTHQSTLGVVLNWEDAGRLYHCLLEITILKERHTGENMAATLAKLLERYGLAKFLHLVVADNATNCDTMAVALSSHIPHFRGMLDRLRCFLHAIQLISKMILRFFNKEYKRKKATSTPAKSKSKSASKKAANTSTTRAAAAASTSKQGASVATASTSVQDEPSDISPDEVAIASALESEQGIRESDEQRERDAGQAMADDEVVSRVKKLAIEQMKMRGVEFTDEEGAHALKVLPRMAGLAIRVRDTSINKIALTELACSQDYAPDPDFGANITTTHTRNATRWGSDVHLMRSFLALRKSINALTSDGDLKLGAFKLDDNDWSLALQLYDMLMCIETLTKRFQETDVPLIIDVIPAFLELQGELEYMSTTAPSLPNICRIAAHAGLLVSREYFNKFSGCQAYAFAIVLCPDRKLDWFRKRQDMFSPEWVAQLRADIIKDFTERWKSAQQTPAARTVPQPQPAPRLSGKERFKPPVSSTVEPTTSGLDDIISYLDSALEALPIPPEPEPSKTRSKKVLPPVIPVLKYWYDALTTRPGLARMALSYTSAPASSLGPETTFSEGRNMMGWNQHQMSFETFRAKMSVGAWCGAPWYSDDIGEQIIAANSRPLRQ